MHMSKNLLPLFLFLMVGCGATSEIALNEALPTARPQAVTTSQPEASVMPQESLPSTSPQPVIAVSPDAAPVITTLKQGDFRNGFHKVSGQARILQLATGPVLRLENFSTENGPDLYVYLVRNDSGSPRNEQEFVNLGKLPSTNGNFNLEIPAETDLSGVQSASIWCRAFSVNFGYAPLK
jgi:hypothetical protein